MSDNEVIEFFNIEENYKKYIRGHHLEQFNKEMYEYIKNRYVPFTNLAEAIYRITHHIDILPVCPICGSTLPYLPNKRRYKKYCSEECKYTKLALILIKEKMKNTWYNKSNEEKHEKIIKTYLTNMIKYGVLNVYLSESVKEKIKQTLLEKYGVDNPQKSEIIKLKSLQTCLEKYGVINGGGSKEALIKIKLTKLERYDDANYNNINKSRLTCIAKYGVDNPFKSDIIKEKSKQTFIKHYGVDNYLKTDEAIKKSHSLESELKRNNTKRKNHTFKSSKAELQFKEYLELNYPNDFEYLYRSELYPFNCDFYIKSLDLYIEIQGSWTHGGHPYNENDKNDIALLENMKLKNTTYYDNAINTWSIRDVQKRNIAKNNKLNYLEIFSCNINDIIYIFNKYIKLA